MIATSPLKQTEENKGTPRQKSPCTKCYTCRLCSKAGKKIAKETEAVPKGR